MKNESGVVAIIFVGLFALLAGMFLGHKVPGIFAAPQTKTTLVPHTNPCTAGSPGDCIFP